MEKQPREMTKAVATLESVLCTEELHSRPSRPPDYETENRALVALGQGLIHSPRTMLQTLADTILVALRGGSAGISFLTDDGKRFHWPAIAGEWKPHVGGGTPRDSSPFGEVLDRDCPLLFRHFEQRYACLLPLTPPAVECLLVPFHVGGKAVGAIWAITHDDRRKFDSEDLRMLVSLGSYAAAAHRDVARLRAFDDEDLKRVQHDQSMREMNERLLVSSLRQHELTELAVRAQAETAPFAAIVSSSHDAIISKNLHGIIRTWNPGAERLFGYTAGEVIGKSVMLLIPADRGDEEADILARIGRGEVVAHYETVRRRKNGSILDISLTMSPFRDATGRIVGAAAIARDITEHRRLEQELARRSAELAAADRVKDQFIALLSHELRTPVFTMSLWIRAIQRPRASKKILHQGLDIISGCCKAQSDLIDELLDVHRISTGKIRLDLSELDLGEAIRSAVERMLPAAAEREIRLHREVDTIPALVRGDNSRIQQVLANLIGNSIKFTPRGGEIRVALRTRDAVAEMSVCDTGEGISAAALPFIFDRFRQEDPLTTRGHDGLGLGLFISKVLVSLHGGTIAAQSAGIGSGATFTITLPLLVGERTPTAPVSNGTPAEVPRRSLAGVLVLVVDDEAAIQQPMRILLHEAGARTAWAASADDALEAIQRRRPDVIVTDICMPGQDGYDLIRSIRALPPERGGRIPAIALTGYAASTDRDSALSAGFQAHIAKPVEPAVLIAAIAALASGSGGEKAP